MPLNKAVGNMYSWVTHTWNPVRGKCGYGCSYCYVKRWGKQPELHLDERELRTRFGDGNVIFVCSGCDLFHPDVPDEWIERVLAAAAGANIGNNWIWHTKNPVRAAAMPADRFPRRGNILCATIESDIPYINISKSPAPWERAVGVRDWKGRSMITVEPVMRFNPENFAEMIIGAHPFQVNIGADSGGNGLPEPSRQDLERLIELLSPHLTNILTGRPMIHLKSNLRRILPESRYYEAV